MDGRRRSTTIVVAVMFRSHRTDVDGVAIFDAGKWIRGGVGGGLVEEGGGNICANRFRPCMRVAIDAVDGCWQFQPSLSLQSDSLRMTELVVFFMMHLLFPL